MKLNRRDFIWVVPSAVTAGFFGWLGWPRSTSSF